MICVSQNIATDVISSSIGNILISDHAPVSILWCRVVAVSPKPPWKLNNFLLEFTGVKDTIKSEIDLFFTLNKGTASFETVWEAFKAFMRFILISQKTYQDWLHHQVNDDLRSHYLLS